jgi:hypothetical protein
MSEAHSGAASPQTSMPREPGTNPFATRFIRPGAATYLFPPGESAERCVDQLADSDWRGQIVGPHGSGKSTLLATLVPRIVRRGRQVEMFQLHGGQRHLPARADPASWTGSSQVVVDGYEQLSAASRWRLHRWCRRTQAGLLITCHRPRQGWPILYRTMTDTGLLQRLVDRLVTDVPDPRRLAPEQVVQAFTEQDGNLREALLQLYDVWESSPQDSSTHVAIGAPVPRRAED